MHPYKLPWEVSGAFVRVGFHAVNEETGTDRGMGTLPAKRKITLSGQDTYNKIGVHVLTFRDLFCGHFEHAGLLHIKKCTLGGWAWYVAGRLKCPRVFCPESIRIRVRHTYS
mgnify:CR=1 FL=1